MMMRLISLGGQICMEELIGSEAQMKEFLLEMGLEPSWDTTKFAR